jgi:hypothetical protein
VSNHGFFSGAPSRLPPDSVLPHIILIYVRRSCDLWKTDEV